MRAGTKLEPDKLYYTKDGTGRVIPFNNARTLDGQPSTITPWETDTRDVWSVGMFWRNIQDIADSPQKAKKIKYGNR